MSFMYLHRSRHLAKPAWFNLPLPWHSPMASPPALLCVAETGPSVVLFPVRSCRATSLPTAPLLRAEQPEQTQGSQSLLLCIALQTLHHPPIVLCASYIVVPKPARRAWSDASLYLHLCILSIKCFCLSVVASLTLNLYAWLSEGGLMSPSLTIFPVYLIYSLGIFTSKFSLGVNCLDGKYM